MSIYEEWIKKAYDKDGQIVKNFWNEYTPREQKIYEHLLKNQITNIQGTPKKLSEKYNVPIESICGFLDGINEAINEPIKIDELTEDTEIDINFSFESLYKKMVEYKAEHLYNLPEWNNVFTEERQKELYLMQKKSGTVVKEIKPGRNDVCPCGSGKKFKKCCGAN